MCIRDRSNGIGAIADTSLRGTLVIEADSSLLEHIKIVQSDGKLRIFTENRISKSSVIKVFLPIESISRISVSSSASFKSEPIIEGKSLDLNLSSGGSVDFELKTKDCRVDASSGGVAKIRGETDKLTINISSGGVVKGASLWASSARVDGSSGGVTSIGVKDELKINLSSGSVLNYHGSPRIVSESISSGGVVKGSEK